MTYTATYTNTNLQSRSLNETNDCYPKALTIATDLTYQEAHKICKFAGRSDKKGTSMSTIRHTLNILKTQGYKITESTPTQYNTRGKLGKISIKTIGRKFPKGTYIILTRTHALAMIDGTIHDWTDGRRHPIETMYLITK